MLRHGKTKKDRFAVGSSGSTSGGAGWRRSRIAHGSSGSFAGFSANDLESHGQSARGWARDRGSPPSPVPALEERGPATPSALGRTAAGGYETGRRTGLFGSLEAQSRAGRVSGGDAAAWCSGTKVGPQAQTVGDLSFAGTAPLAQSGTGHPASQSPALCPGGMEKKRSPKSWRPC